MVAATCGTEADPGGADSPAGVGPVARTPEGPSHLGEGSLGSAKGGPKSSCWIPPWRPGRVGSWGPRLWCVTQNRRGLCVSVHATLPGSPCRVL